MAESRFKRRLSPMDALFLFADSDVGPMTVGVVGLLDGQLPLQEFRQHLDARLDRVPRYRQRVVPAPFHIGMPTWEDDPEFDLKRHVRRKRLRKTVSEDRFFRIAESCFEERLPEYRPLWDVLLVPKVAGDQTGIIIRVHHAMLDGVAGVGLLQALFDATPHAAAAGGPQKRRRRKAEPIPDRTTLFYDALWDNAVGGIEHWARFQWKLAEFAGSRSPRRLVRSMRAFQEQLGALLTPTRRFRFNSTQDGTRHFAFVDISLEHVRRICRTAKCTVNDVVLATLAGSMTAYIEAHGDNTLGEELFVVCPVNVRSPAKSHEMGNRISFMPVRLPLDVDDPSERLSLVAKSTRKLKSDGVPDMIGLLFAALQGAAPPVQKAVLNGLVSEHAQSAVDQFPQLPPGNLVCTNVPGPDKPLYACGRKLTRYYPVMPVALRMGLGCAVMSYAGKLRFSFVGDGACAPDVDLLREFHRFAFEELHEEVLATEPPPEIAKPEAADPVDEPVPDGPPFDAEIRRSPSLQQHF